MKKFIVMDLETSKELETFINWVSHYADRMNSNNESSQKKDFVEFNFDIKPNTVILEKDFYSTFTVIVSRKDGSEFSIQDEKFINFAYEYAYVANLPNGIKTTQEYCEELDKIADARVSFFKKYKGVLKGLDLLRLERYELDEMIDLMNGDW